MDLRTQKTRSSIIDAFIELRSKKPIEKITVTELSRRAVINKATFYKHYRDIYDLSESLENEIIASMLQSIPEPDKLISDPYNLSKGIFYALTSQTRLLNILFSGSREACLIRQLEIQIKDMIFRQHPDFKEDLEKQLQLTVLIRGTFYAFLQYGQNDLDSVIDILGQICRNVMQTKTTSPESDPV